MSKLLLALPGTTIEITPLDRFFFTRVTGLWTDEVVLKVIEQLNPLIDAIPDSHIRVLDLSGIQPGGFLITAAIVERASSWARQVNERKPGSLSYLVSPTTLSFAMGRMYAMHANLEASGIAIIRSLDDLPPEIRAKLPTE